jgi:hypothetical protein
MRKPGFIIYSGYQPMGFAVITLGNPASALLKYGALVVALDGCQNAR